MRVHVLRDTLLIDEPLQLAASGCEPGKTVEVAATIRTPEAVGRSSAMLVALDDGTIDIATDASMGGSYSGVDPYGLWWSAEPAVSVDRSWPAPVRCDLRVTGNGVQRDDTVRHSWTAPGVAMEEVRETGVAGLFGRPAGRGPFPGVVAFGGSAGGLGPAAQWAPLLASRGFATIALAYFGARGLPDKLVGIEVEAVERAIRWLDGRADVSGDRVAVIGGSCGGELALLAGSLLEQIGGVVAFVPSHVSWGGPDAGGAVDAPAWTFRGRPIPYAPIGELPRSDAHPSSGMTMLRAAFSAAVEDPDSLRDAEIPIERVGVALPDQGA